MKKLTAVMIDVMPLATTSHLGAVNTQDVGDLVKQC